MKKETLNGMVLGENVAFSKELNKVLEDGVKDILNQAKRYQNNSLSSATGFVAESYHCANFNAKSVLRRETLMAFREKSGNHGDYFIKDIKTDKIIERGEMKYYSTAEKTENAMRGYGNRKLIGPKEQIEDIKKIAKRKSLSNKSTRPEVAKDHEIVVKKVSAYIGKKTKSDSLSLKDAKKLTKKARKGKVNSNDILPKDAIFEALKSGAIEGAKKGAIFSSAFSVIENIQAVNNGKKEVAKAVVDVMIETTKGAVDCAIKSAAGSAAKLPATKLTEKTANSVAKSVLKSSAPVMAAVAGVEITKNAVDLVKGEIDGEEFAKKSTKTVVTTAGGWAGAEIGATIGSVICPGIGTVVGGIVGGILGSLSIDSLFDF